jgi:flagellar biogenesis protein FliO
MDHVRSCGVFALATFIISIGGVMSVSVAEPPASGVGDAAISPRVAEPAAPTSAERLDPKALAERIAARMAAADAARVTDAAPPPASAPAPASAHGPTPVQTASSLPIDAIDAEKATILPAPRPNSGRFIDRFERSDAEGPGGESGLSAVTDGWWSSPEMRVGLLLAAFVAVAIVARRWSNARGPRAGRPSGVLSVLARYPFGRGASLVLLEVGPRMVLVHQQNGRGGEVRPIAEFTTNEEIAELRTRLGIARREADPGFGRDLERHLGLYDRKGRPQGFGGPDGLPLDDVMETVDLTRRRPRRGNRTN